ncbi:MAG: hypothetical protein PHH70_03045 [Candidatus Gracilibacteria bacterium]|nr:hypothetical protein [Candidatus Gracilibacteria bacterium]
MFGLNQSQDESKNKLINFIIRIEEINKESLEMVRELSETLTTLEKTYGEMTVILIDSMPSNEKIENLRSHIMERGKFLEGAMETLIDENVSILDKNSLYIMVIKVLGEMILCYRTLISEIDYINK